QQPRAPARHHRPCRTGRTRQRLCPTRRRHRSHGHGGRPPMTRPPLLQAAALPCATRLPHDTAGGTGLYGLLSDLGRAPDHLLDAATGYGPITALSILGAAAAWTSVRWVLWDWRNSRLVPGARLIEVAVPPKVESASAAAWWARLIGLTHPRWKRLIFGQPHLAFEYHADHNGIHFHIWVPGTIPPGIVEKTIRASWPGAPHHPPSHTTTPARPGVPGGGRAAGPGPPRTLPAH